MSRKTESRKKERTELHVVDYVTQRDVDVVLGRLPASTQRRIQRVHLKDAARWRVRVLGMVRGRRREIDLFSRLPPRVSLRGYMYAGRVPQDYGAPAHGQWPPWAVRRFLLYDTLLHEIGHGRAFRRRFYREPLANVYAASERAHLFGTPFEHSDPVHNAPSTDELAFLPVWAALDKRQRYALVMLVLSAPHAELPDLSMLGELEPAARRFLERALRPLDAHESRTSVIA